jgi:uncharacterized membrane protein
MTSNDLVSFSALIAILAMAAVTQIWRLGGFWLMGHVPLTLRVRRMLEALPGAVVVAIVLPVLVKNGQSAFIAVAAVIAAMVYLRSELVAIGAGLVVAALVRAAGL